MHATVLQLFAFAGRVLSRIELVAGVLNITPI